METQEDCSICLTTLTKKNSNLKKLKCGHIFHYDCINKWYNEDINGRCPYCRETIDIPYIFYFQNINHKYQLYDTYIQNFIHKTINGLKIYNIENTFYNNANPSCWSKEIYNKNELFLPLYSFELKNDIYISLYARLYILYSYDVDITLIEKKSFNNITYYDIDKNIFDNFPKKSMKILFDWMYDVMTIFKSKYNIIYLSGINTLIMDLLLLTIKEFDEYTNYDIFQGILTCSIYNSIIFLEKKNITLDNVNYYTNYSYKSVDLEKYNQFQKEYINKNINLL